MTLYFQVTELFFSSSLLFHFQFTEADAWSRPPPLQLVCHFSALVPLWWWPSPASCGLLWLLPITPDSADDPAWVLLQEAVALLLPVSASQPGSRDQIWEISVTQESGWSWQKCDPIDQMYKSLVILVKIMFPHWDDSNDFNVSSLESLQWFQCFLIGIRKVSGAFPFSLAWPQNLMFSQLSHVRTAQEGWYTH